jgi:coenzyme F420-dependent glucose-6-phosphate dehydrogenase
MNFLKIYWYLGHEEFQPEVLVRHAVLAEEAGFDGVLVSEHFHPWVDDFGAGGFAFSTLGAIAAVTNKLELMTAVTTPLWRFHPAVVAQAAATIDRLSDGRFALGVGTGVNLNEGSLGYEFGNYSERSGRMREAIGIMGALLDGQKLDFDGKYYQTKSAKLYSPPISKVPIYLAAGAPKSAAMAGEIADGVIASVKNTADTMAKVIEPAKEAASQAARRVPTVVAMHWTIRGRNDAEATKVLRPWRGLRAPGKFEAIDPAQLRQEADAMDPAEILAQYQIVATAEDYTGAYGELVTKLKPDILGIQTSSVDQIETIRMLGSEVLPELRRLAKE